MVGVAHAAGREIPRLVPSKPLGIDEDSHELGDDERGVRLVEVDEHLVWESVPAGVRLAVAAQNVAQRAADEEVLLAEAQLLAGHRIVVGIEHLGEVFGEHLRLDRFHIGTLVEVGEVEFIDSLRAPEPQRVDGVVVADDRQIVGHAFHGALGHPAPLLAALDGGVFHAAAEMNVLLVLGTLYFPRIAVLEPSVGFFHLVAVQNLLAEDAVVVPEAVAGAGDVQGGHRIEVASRQTPKAAVAEAGISLVIAQIVPVDAVILQRLAAKLVGLEVDYVVAQEAPHEELEG